MWFPRSSVKETKKMSKMRKFVGENQKCVMILFVTFGPSLCLKNIRQGIPCLGRVYLA